MKQFTINLAKKAGREILKKFNHDKIIKIKKRSQILTQADLIADRIIVSAIKKKYPQHNILSEESKHKQNHSDYLWVIDPLDGTTNYSIGNPMFAVSIGLFHKNEPVLAAAYAPALDELFYAEKNKGAYLNGKKIKVSNRDKLSESFLTYCHGSTVPAIKKALKIHSKFKLIGMDSRQLGSAALELGFVAAGRTDCIVIPGAHPWDVGAGVLIVREAGGKVTDFQDKEWNLKSKDIAASNGKIHNDLIKFLKKI